MYSCTQYTRTHLSVHMLGVAVQPEVRVLPPEAVVLQDVQHARHLTEDEHAGAFLLEARQQLVQGTHLAAIGNQVVVRGKGGTWRRRRGQTERLAHLQHTATRGQL